MDREEVIRMARDAGVLQSTDTEVAGLMIAGLKYFAGLVAAKEREACALACEVIETDKWALYKGRAPYTGREPGRASDYTQGECGGAGECAAAIRARGATDEGAKR